MAAAGIAATGLAGVAPEQAAATTYTWINNADGTWSTPGNWDVGAPVSSTSTALIFGGTSDYTATDDIGTGAFTLNSLEVSNTGATTIAPNATGNTLTFNGTTPALTIDAAAGAVTINNNLIFAGTTNTVTNNSANTLTLGGAVTYNASKLTTYTGSGSITAATAQTFNASSSVVYTGSGTLTLGPTSGTGINFGSGSISITNGVSGGGSTGTLTLADGGTYAGTGTVNLYNYSSGALTIGNMAAVTGTLSVMAGTVQFAGNVKGDLFGNGITLNVASGATFNFAGNGETMGAISGAGTITGAGMTLNTVGNHTWAGSITGSGLTLSPGVNYLLSGNNTTTGTLTLDAATATVPAATATLGAGGTTGAWTRGNIVDNGILTFNRSDAAYVYGAAISGTGVVNVIGTGTITFSGSNTYLGATTVTNGTLAITSATALPTGGSTNVVNAVNGMLDVSGVSGGYTFAANQNLIVGHTGTASNDVVGSTTVQGLLDVGGVNTPATATFANDLTLNGATLNLDLGSAPGTGTDLLNVLGNLNVTGANIININNPAAGNGTYTVITYGGTLTGDASNLSVSPASAGRGIYTFDTTSHPGAILLNSNYVAANLTWVGNASNNVWDLTQTVNWTGAPGQTPDNRFYNGDNVTFDDSGVGGDSNLVMINNVVQPGSVTINGTQDYNFNNSGGGYIAGIGSLTDNNSGTVTINTPNTYTGPTNANAGTLTFVSPGSVGGALNVNGATVNLIPGAVSNGPITVNSGTLNFANNTAYSKTITINGGTVNSAPGAFTTNAIALNGGQLIYETPSDVLNTMVLTFNGGTLALPAGIRYSTGTGAQPWVIGPGGGTVDVQFGTQGTPYGQNPPADGKQGNSFSGSGPFTLMSSTGYGVFNVGSNKSAFTGTTTVMAGATLQFTSNQFANADSITIEPGATYQIYDTTSGPYSLKSGATLNLNGDGVPLVGTGVFENGTPSNIGGAFLHLPAWGEGPSPDYAINIPIVLQSDARITELNASANTGYPGDGTTTDIFTKQISGPGSLIKDGDGVLVISNISATTPNNYAGMTIVSDGTLQLSNGGNTGATMAGGGANLLPTGTTVQLGEASANNSGTLDLYGNAQTIAGLTTAGAGTAQQVINSNATTAASLTVNYTGTTPQTFAGQIGGASGADAIAFTKSGSGTFVMTGTNYYTGATTVAGGTLAIGSQASLPSTSPTITVAPGAVLDLSASGEYSFATNQKLVAGRPGGGTSDVIGATTINGGTLDIGGPNNPATATFQNDLVLTNATVDFDLSNSPTGSNDRVAVGGNLGLLGANNIAVALTGGALTNGNYTLFTYTGGLSGDASNLSLSGVASGTTRQSYTFDTTSKAGAVLLDVSGSAANLTWVGNGSANNWDLVTTPNFTGAPGSTPDNRFYNFDSVTFDGTGVGDPTPVNLVGTLQPASVTVTGAQNYTFAGSGSITGSGPLNMNGTGTLTIATANTFTGTTTASDGTLAFTTGGTVGGPLVVNGGTVNLVAGAVTAPITVTSGTLNVAASSGLSNTFTVNGGTVNAATGAFNGPITINEGVVNGATGAFNGNIELDGGKLAYASATDTANNAILTINGGTLVLPATVPYSTGSAVQPWVIGPNGATVDVQFGMPTVQYGQGPTVNSKQGNSLSGSGPFTLMSSTGYGVLNIGSNLSTFTGTSTVMSGATLRFTSNQFSSAGNVTIEPGATYELADTTSGPYSLAIGASLILNGDGVPLQGTGPGGSNVGGAFLHVPDSSEGLSPTYAINMPIVLQTNARITELDASTTTGYSGPGVTTDIFTHPISGPGNLIKDGDGVMVVANNSATPNNYTGLTVISNGTLKLSNGGTTAATLTGGATDLLPTGTTVQFGEATSNNSGTLDLYGNDQTVGGLTTANTATGHQIINSNAATPATLTVNYSGTTPQTFSGQIGGGTTASPVNAAISLIKSGTGTFALTGKNTLSGNVAINGGTLLVNGQTGPDSGTGTAAVAVNAGGTLGGTGNVAGPVVVNASGNASPGGVITAGTPTSTGLLTTGAQTWTGGSDANGTGGGTYVWKLNVNNAGTPGTLNNDASGTNWDQLITSSLTMSASATNAFNIQLTGISGPSGNGFNQGAAYQWVIATVPNGGNIANLNASMFHLTTANLPAASGFSVDTSTNLGISDPSGATDVILSYAPAPEPTGLLLAGGAIAPLLLRRRRRQAGR